MYREHDNYFIYFTLCVIYSSSIAGKIYSRNPKNPNNMENLENNTVLKACHVHDKANK